MQNHLVNVEEFTQIKVDTQTKKEIVNKFNTITIVVAVIPFICANEIKIKQVVRLCKLEQGCSRQSLLTLKEQELLMSPIACRQEEKERANKICQYLPFKP